MRKAIIALIFLAGCVAVCHAQISDENAKSIAMAATRVASNFPESKSLRAHRREDLEDQLFDVQLKIKGKIAKAAYFYEVTDEGSFVMSPDEAVIATSADGHFMRVVAVSVSTGEAYLLYGFDHALAEFNRLAKDAVLVIDSTGEAWTYGSLCFASVVDPSGRSLVYSSRDLRHQVEDYYFFNYSEKEAASLYRKWWERYSSKRLKAPFGTVASKNSAGYEVTMAILTGSSERIPILKLMTWQISPAGRIELTSNQTLN